MLKVVVFDNGYGGEFFADILKERLPIVDIVRVIDWRRAQEIQQNPKSARRIAEEDLRPYIGKVDLIILANHLLTITSLRYFRRRYKEQKFLGLRLKLPDSPSRKEALVLTTKAVTKTLDYYNYRLRAQCKIRSIVLESWPGKIDDGELTTDEIAEVLGEFIPDKSGSKEIVLACSQFHDIKAELYRLFGRNLKIYDSFDDTLRETCKTLRIRGGSKKIK